MSDQSEFEKDLGELLAKGQVCVVVGSGVSVGATENAPAASWSGLLKLGVTRCGSLDPTLGKAWEDGLLAQIQSGKLIELLSVADEICNRLGAPRGGEFRRFLRETVGALQATKPDVLNGLRDLGAPVVTTNYDSLLEMATGLGAITWRDKSKVFRVLQGQENGILHLHGHWADSESVVLGTISYDGVVKDDHAQATIHSLAMRYTFLFVGCGEGLSDPNFGPFRAWLKVIGAENEARHYRLAVERDVVTFHRQHLPGEHVCVLSYGGKHDDLAGYLHVLLRKKVEAAQRLAAARPANGKNPTASTPTTPPPPFEATREVNAPLSDPAHESLKKGLNASVAAFQEALCSVKNLQTSAKVAKLFGITSLDSPENLEQQIRLVLDCPKRDNFFSRAMGSLRALHDLLPASSDDDRRVIFRLQKLLVSRVFPIAQIRDAVEGVMINKGVIAGAGATCIAPEYLTRLAAGLKPDFDYSGMMHLVRTPLGDSSPTALIHAVLLDLSDQAGFSPEADTDKPITEERMLALARKLRASVIARSNLIFIKNQAPDDNTPLGSPLCYCVFPKLKDDESAKRLHALVGKIVTTIPELVFFELDKEADIDGHEHVALQYIGGPSGQQAPKS